MLGNFNRVSLDAGHGQQHPRFLLTTTQTSLTEI